MIEDGLKEFEMQAEKLENQPILGMCFEHTFLDDPNDSEQSDEKLAVSRFIFLAQSLPKLPKLAQVRLEFEI